MMTMASPEVPSASAPRKRGTATTVKLASGGTVTLSLSVDLFSLGRPDRDFILDLVDRLAEYARENTDPTTAAVRAAKS